jgi:septal ring factor EnvC (AmiA/AmiB activator)
MNGSLTKTTAFRPVVAGTVMFAAMIALPPESVAQSSATKSELPGNADNDILKARALELAAIRAEQQRAAETEARLRREIEALGTDRRKLNTDLIGTAARMREVEARLSATEARVAPLEAQEQDLRQSLSDRRGTIAEILAALQRMGRRPPPALLVSPEDAAKSLRSAIVLGAFVPELRDRAERISTDLLALQRLRGDIASERSKLSDDLKTLGEDQKRMTLLVEERQKQQAESEKALEQSRNLAATLARQAESLNDLVARLEQGLDNAARAARKVPEPDHKGATRPSLAALNDPGRMSPAINFATARAMLPMPVNGVKIRDFGASDGLGGTERGISVATRPGAQVTSPCDGWVVYAGPFRSYGQLLILNAGGGYHVVIAGMDRISVEIGQFILTGEPIAVMGSGTTKVAVASSVEARQMGTSQPVLYVEFRKDGTPVDSGPWWVKKESEKVRG